LNHHDQSWWSPWLRVWIGEIPANAKVYDWLGRETTPGEVFASMLRKCAERVHFNLDHEDAGFFVPAEEARKNRVLGDLPWQEVLPGKDPD